MAATVMAILCGGANLVLLRLVLVGVARLRSGSRGHGTGRMASSST
ncbi:hypothetical protein ACF3NS_10425 [Arsenicicoccus cauae]